jgi:Zn-dependent oligopeptidase
MASIDQAVDLIRQMVTASQPAAAREHEKLTAFARQLSGDPQLRLQWWDVEYYSELQKEQQFNLSQQELQQYLPLDSVMKGLVDVSVACLVLSNLCYGCLEECIWYTPATDCCGFAV